MKKLIPINRLDDIPPTYQDSSIGRMLAYHNLGQSPDNYPAAQLLIVTCMDFRVHLNIPDRFAYVIRTGGR